MNYREFKNSVIAILEEETDVEVAMHFIRELYESMEEEDDY